MMLLKGILKHGYGNWLVITIDGDLQLSKPIKKVVADVDPIKAKGVPHPHDIQYILLMESS